MRHSALGPRPGDLDQARPEPAARLRSARVAIASRAIAAAVARDPSLRARFDERMLGLFSRDEDRHLEEVARALEAGHDAAAVAYADSIVPVMRRRGIPMRDVATLLLGLADTFPAVLPEDAAAGATRIVGRMIEALDRPEHLAGDRPRGRLAGLLWKASGFGGW